MCFRGRGNMISSNSYRRKLVCLGFLLVAGCLAPVRSGPVPVLTASSSLKAGQHTLVSQPLNRFELGIFPYAGENYLCIRYALPIEQKVTFVANRGVPLGNNAEVQLSNGILQLYNPDDDHNQFPWKTSNAISAVTAKLNDTGNLLLMDGNGTIVWDSFKNEKPTDTLLPGQYMYRNQSHNLTSWQKNGDPGIKEGSYTFGWKDSVLSLSWTSPKDFIIWKGGSYIPAPDVHNAHKIEGVEYIYFHETLGHLYIGSTPADTAILSGGPDVGNPATLKHITIAPDGGLRIMQSVQNSTNYTSWNATANWVISERPDSRSQCTVYGTCGPYGQCLSPVDSLAPVQCQCPDGFKPINGSDFAQGCSPPDTLLDMKCTNSSKTATFLNTTNVTVYDMITLEGVDMPWGGDMMILEGNASENCKEVCAHNCWCAGAVKSRDEQKCWLKTGILYNIGYPTEALHGNDRISYIRNRAKATMYDPPAPSRRKPVAVIVGSSVGAGIVLVLICACLLCRRCNGTLREKLQWCGLCRARTGARDIYPGSDSERPGSGNITEVDSGRVEGSFAQSCLPRRVRHGRT